MAYKVASEAEDGPDEDEETPHHLALQMMYGFASEIHSDIMFPLLMKYFQIYISSKSPLERKAAIKMLGFISESEACLNKIKENVDELTDVIVNKMKDESFLVREATAEVVGRFSENVVPDFLDRHEKVLPVLMEVIKELESSSDQTLQKALYALNEFCENLNDEVTPYVDQLVPILLTYIGSNASRDVKHSALSALGAVTSSAEEAIVPYYEQMMTTLKTIVDNVQDLKGQAL
jgi:hypothetical protein